MQTKTRKTKAELRKTKAELLEIIHQLEETNQKLESKISSREKGTISWPEQLANLKTRYENHRSEIRFLQNDVSRLVRYLKPRIEEIRLDILLGVEDFIKAYNKQNKKFNY